MKQSLIIGMPEGLLVTRRWLGQHGLTRSNIDYCLRRGKLQTLCSGLYTRQAVPLKWQHVVYSLLEQGVCAYVGGRSALELAGLAHYVNPAGMAEFELYGTVSVPPRWVSKLQSGLRFNWHANRLFPSAPGAEASTKAGLGLDTLLFGNWDWRIPIATPERAILEFLDQVPLHASFQHAEQVFENAVNLRPGLLTDLLRSCHSVKAKRLFLWFVERHAHAWGKRLDLSGVDLGAGKRCLVKGGVLDVKYGITVPREMTGHVYN